MESGRYRFNERNNFVQLRQVKLNFAVLAFTEPSNREILVVISAVFIVFSNGGNRRMLDETRFVGPECVLSLTDLNWNRLSHESSDRNNSSLVIVETLHKLDIRAIIVR